MGEGSAPQGGARVRPSIPPGTTIVREGWCRLADGTVLDPATELSCGCVYGKSGVAFIILLCRPECEAAAFCQQAFADQGKPIGFATGAGDIGELKRRYSA